MPEFDDPEYGYMVEEDAVCPECEDPDCVGLDCTDMTDEEIRELNERYDTDFYPEIRY